MTNEQNEPNNEGEENSRRANAIADAKIEATKRKTEDPKERVDLSERAKQRALAKLASRNSAVTKPAK